VNRQIDRRQVLKCSAAWTGALAMGPALSAQPAAPPANGSKARKFRLGLVTYELAAKWNLPTLLKVCKDVGLAALEFRTTHKHGVEPTLPKPDRADVRKRCADAGLACWSLGSICEFQAPDPAVVEKNIEETKRFIDLAHDIGAKAVKVRPNGLPKNVLVEKTLEQIGKSLATCGQAAADVGVEIWCEVHGPGTAKPAHMRKIMDFANHPAVGVTWNSNATDVKDGSVKENFELLRPKVYCCHINELTSDYPYRELFALLNATGYDRFTLNECKHMNTDDVEDTTRFLRFYKALWEEMSRPV
jgi:sugar phosphate isomerase/epimerase